jgi:L-lactate dehydrogenase
MKISIVGIGKVGGAMAFATVMKGIASEVVLVGRDVEKVRGDAYDLLHASAFIRPMKVIAGTAEDTAGSDIIFICAAVPTPGVTDRLQMAQPNAELLKQLIPPLAKASPRGVFVVLTNPVDVATYLTMKIGDLPPSQVLGTGTLIDTGRFRALLSQATGINALDLRAYILGEHGESQFPALSVASAGGVKFKQGNQTVLKLFEQARRGGWQVLNHKGYTNYAVASSGLLIAEAIDDDSKAVMPVSTYVDGFRDLPDVCLSLPCVVGRRGVEQVLPIDLDDQETLQLRQSAAILRETLDLLKF